jgi:hypothetical protein
MDTDPDPATDPDGQALDADPDPANDAEPTGPGFKFEFVSTTTPGKVRITMIKILYSII